MKVIFEIYYRQYDGQWIWMVMTTLRIPFLNFTHLAPLISFPFLFFFSFPSLSITSCNFSCIFSFFPHIFIFQLFSCRHPSLHFSFVTIPFFPSLPYLFHLIKPYIFITFLSSLSLHLLHPVMLYSLFPALPTLPFTFPVLSFSEAF